MPIDFPSLIRVTIPRLSATSVGGIIYSLLPYILGIAGFLILIYIILGGFQILASQGDPKAIAAGQQKITYAIVGFIILFVAYWIVQLIAAIFDLGPIRTIFRRPSGPGL